MALFGSAPDPSMLRLLGRLRRGWASSLFTMASISPSKRSLPMGMWVWVLALLGKLLEFAALQGFLEVHIALLPSLRISAVY